MAEATGIFILIIILYFLFEYRVKRPDDIVLFEKSGKILLRKGKLYPRHFSKSILNKSNSLVLNFEAEARGKLPILVKIALTVAASYKHLGELVLIGGWDKNAVANTSKELEILLLGFVKAYTEKYEIEDLKSEGLAKYIKESLSADINSLGLQLLSVSVQSIDPADKSIAEAMKQKESARILEEKEKESQKARINTVKIKVDAEEKIARLEHELALKKYELKKAEEKHESVLANARIEEELKRKKLQLAVDKEELALLKDNPELLLLSPQTARLAEASQSLKNAKTVVSLTKENADQGFHLIGMFQTFLQNMIDKSQKKK